MVSQNRLRIGLFSFSLIVVSALLVFDASAQQQPLVLKIGIQGVLSGELAAYGDRQKGGVNFALSKAGEIMIAGRPLKIELVFADDQGRAELGPVAAQQLIDAGVSVVIGPGFTGPTASAMPLFKQAKIPALSPFTSGNNLADIGGGWYFRISSRNDCQGQNLTKIAKAMGAKKVAIVDDNEAYGADISKFTAENLKKIGIEITGTYHGALGMIDWSPIIQRLRQDNPNLVIYNGYHTEAGRLFQQARERGFTVPFLGSDGIAEPGIWKVADPAKLTDVSAIRNIPPQLVEGTSSPEWKKFQAEYPPFAKSIRLSVTEADQYSARTVEATNLLLDAVVRAQSTDSQKIADAIRSTKYVGMSGTFEFESNGERKGCPASYFKPSGNEWKPVPMPGQ